MNWIDLNTEAQLEEIIRLSSDPNVSAVAIYKHSTRCGTCHLVQARLERTWSYDPQKVPLYFLDLLAHRNVSNAVAERFHVEHESPQLLLIKNGKCIYHTSHTAINAGDVEMFV